MALYLDEEEVWKCPKHPSKRRRSGICPICLRDRLVILCPECANVRPCSCCATSSSSSSSSSSTVGRVYSLIDQEPALRRSRSMAIPLLRSRSRFSAGGGAGGLDLDGTRDSPAINGSRSARSFWSMFKSHKGNREREIEPNMTAALAGVDGDLGDVSGKVMMQRSRSVAVAAVSGNNDGELRPKSKGRGWFFPSPMKAFRQSKASKVVQERSPLYRG